MDMHQTINITIDNKDAQEQKQKQDVSTDDGPGNSVKVKSSTKESVKDVK